MVLRRLLLLEMIRERSVHLYRWARADTESSLVYTRRVCTAKNYALGAQDPISLGFTLSLFETARATPRPRMNDFKSNLPEHVGYVSPHRHAVCASKLQSSLQSFLLRFCLLCVIYLKQSTFTATFLLLLRICLLCVIHLMESTFTSSCLAVNIKSM